MSKTAKEEDNFAEVRKKLLEKGFTEDEIEATIQKYKDDGIVYLNNPDTIDALKANLEPIDEEDVDPEHTEQSTHPQTEKNFVSLSISFGDIEIGIHEQSDDEVEELMEIAVNGVAKIMKLIPKKESPEFDPMYV